MCNSINPKIVWFHCNFLIIPSDLFNMKSVKGWNIHFESLSTEIKTAVMDLLFHLNRALLISSFNIVLAFALLFLERKGDA